jgi:hypothetical protein
MDVTVTGSEGMSSMSMVQDSGPMSNLSVVLKNIGVQVFCRIS